MLVPPRTSVAILQQFFSEVHSVSGQLHDTYKLAHLDIRLDNKCFNQQFKPILIDLDRSEGLGTEKVCQSDYASCMSRSEMSPEKTDWMQLGWLIAWILEPGEDYHDRDFEGLSDNMKENAMLKTLIHTLLRHSFGVVQAHRTSSNLHETHQHRDSKVCWVLLHSFGVVQAQRTYPNHTITEIKVCRVLLH